MMSISTALELLGGVTTRRQLVAMTSRAQVDRALESGDVVVLATDRYAHPGVDQARAAAHRLSGVVSHSSAALAHGWAVWTTPRRPVVTVPRNRHLAPGQADGVDLRWGRLDLDDVRDGVTTPDRTLLDCGRSSDYCDALAVFDSALRSGVSPQRLDLLAASVRGPGSRQVRQLCKDATGLAQNAFESATRSIVRDVQGLCVRPQVPLWAGAEFLGCPDLVDDRLRIVIEADSFAWHGSRSALVDDARRYNAMSVNGWLVLRLTWDEVRNDPAYVRRIVEAAVAQQEERMWRSVPVRR